MLKGILPVIPTLFTRQNVVDREAMRRVIRFALDAGAHGVVFPGVASESSYLSVTERGELMALVHDRNDLEPVIEASIGSGFLESSERERTRALLKSLVEHPELKEHFEPGLEVLYERHVFVSVGTTVIPDRLVFRGRRVWIIDYKTGAEEEKHVEQINQYARVMQQMGYEVEERLLIYVEGSVKVVKIDAEMHFRTDPIE